MADVNGLAERSLCLGGVRALVAGADAEVGRAVALALARAGAAVCACGVPFPWDGPSIALIEGKADDRAGCAQTVERALAAVGGLDLVVNCVASDPAGIDTDDVSATYDQIVHHPLRRLYFLNQAVYDVMKKYGGRIINIAPAMARTSGIGPATAAVRTGLAQLTRTMAVEWAKEKIRVNCVLLPSSANSADDVAAFIVALASDASAHMSGQSFHLDGGATAGGSWDQP